MLVILSVSLAHKTKILWAKSRESLAVVAQKVYSEVRCTKPPCLNGSHHWADGGLRRRRRRPSMVARMWASAAYLVRGLDV